jgi:hypothetical protein
VQINYEFHGPVTSEAAIDVIEQYRRGELVARTVSGTTVAKRASSKSGGTA